MYNVQFVPSKGWEVREMFICFRLAHNSKIAHEMMNKSKEKQVAESAENQMLRIRCEKLYFSSNLKVSLSSLLNVSIWSANTAQTHCHALHVYFGIIFRTFLSFSRGMKEFGRSFQHSSIQSKHTLFVPQFFHFASSVSQSTSNVHKSCWCCLEH